MRNNTLQKNNVAFVGMLFDYIPQKKPESLLLLTMRFFLDFLLEYDILVLSKEEIMISVYFYFRILWRVRAGIPLIRFHFVLEEEFYGAGKG